MLYPGTRLGPYEIVAPLGAGGMGQVWRAHDTRLKRDVAIKVLPAEFASDPERLERFQREARATAALSHPNILPIFDFGSHDGSPYIVEELVEGESLRTLIQRGPLGVDEAVALASQIASGLAAAHDKRIVHRDLKPENVIVGPDRTVKVLDFGLAKFVAMAPSANDATLSRAPTGATEWGTVLGTAAYMAPEQATGRPVDVRADVFALGIVLYEMLAGRRPFEGATATEVVAAILKDAPPPLAESVPAYLRQLVDRCLQKAPDRRPTSAREVLAALQAGSVTPATPRPRPLRSRLALVAAAVVGTLAVVAGVILRVHLRGNGEADPRRILVVPFENLTGDRSLDPVARLALDAVAGGLAELEFVRVSEAARAPAAEDSAEALLGLAARKGAGTIVTGSYSLSGDALELRARLLDARSGSLLLALEPATGPRVDPQRAVAALKDVAMGAVAYQFGPVATVQLGRAARYEAYREYVTAITAAGPDFRAARGHLERAVEIDPDYWMARLRLVVTYLVLGETAKASEMLASVEGTAAQLAPTELLYLEFAKAMRQNRRPDALRAAKELLRLAPRELILSYQVAWLAVTLNRPREALNALGDVAELQWGELSKWPHGEWVIHISAAAHHYLGEYDKALADAQLGLKYYPNLQRTYEDLVRSYAGLGRLADVEGVIATSLTLPPDRYGSAGTVMLAAAEELGCHGHPEEAIRVALRCDRWYAAHPPADAEGKISTANRAEILWLAQRWADARVAAEQFAKENPGSVHAPGLLGVMAARAGDRAAAAECDASLAKFDQRRKGSALEWRSRIAAQLGDKQRAVDLLRDAIANGLGFGDFSHCRVYMENLQGYPPLEELLKPQG